MFARFFVLSVLTLFALAGFQDYAAGFQGFGTDNKFLKSMPGTGTTHSVSGAGAKEAKEVTGDCSDIDLAVHGHDEAPVSCEGPVVNGKAHGNWIVRFPNEHIHEGPYVDGMMHGHWQERYANGVISEGPVVNGKRDGNWTVRYADGGVMKGPFVDGKRSGNWVLRFADGDVGEGPFVDGKRSGRWITRLPYGRCNSVVWGAGKRYDGTYVEGTYKASDNSCVVKRSSNCSYVESISYGGAGRPDEEHGDVCEGSVVDGKAHGNWVIRFANGDVHEGPFVDGERHGHWVLREADGEVEEGPFVDGKAQGNWIGRFTDGSISEGRLVDGKKHGRWINRFPDGRCTSDEWSDGVQVDGTYVEGTYEGNSCEAAEEETVMGDCSATHDTRSLLVSDSMFGEVNCEGPVVDGKRHGNWIIRYEDGRVSEGPFVDGKAHGYWFIGSEGGKGYEGHFVDGKMHGRWIKRFSDGTCTTAEFSHGAQLSLYGKYSC